MLTHHRWSSATHSLPGPVGQPLSVSGLVNHTGPVDLARLHAGPHRGSRFPTCGFAALMAKTGYYLRFITASFIDIMLRPD